MDQAQAGVLCWDGSGGEPVRNLKERERHVQGLRGRAPRTEWARCGRLPGVEDFKDEQVFILFLLALCLYLGCAWGGGKGERAGKPPGYCGPDAPALASEGNAG